MMATVSDNPEDIALVLTDGAIREATGYRVHLAIKGFDAWGFYVHGAISRPGWQASEISTGSTIGVVCATPQEAADLLEQVLRDTGAEQFASIAQAGRERAEELQQTHTAALAAGGMKKRRIAK